MSRADTSAAIVAGGHATRMSGRDKSRLVIEGRPIIVRQTEILQSVAATVVVVGGTPARFNDLGLEVWPDRIPGAGALGGIYTALAGVETPLVLIVGCDMPFLDPGLLNHLAGAVGTRDGAWVVTHRGPEPLLACYRSDSAGRVEAEIRAGRLRASALADVMDIASVGTDVLARYGDPARLIANVNTPDDYARIQYGFS